MVEQAGTDAAAHGLAAGAGRRESWLVGLLALALAALFVLPGLRDPTAVLLGVDTATTQLPWSAAAPALEGPAAPRPDAPRNAALADQGMVFYPAYRWVLRSWAALDVPLWNPWIHAGSPALGNPQLGVLDPQVLVLLPLELLGARYRDVARDFGYTLLAWLRIAAALTGAYLLARRLGLGPPAAAFAGVSFGLSGFLVLWLGHSLGHVAPFLPWVWLGVLGCGGARRRRAFVWTALALCGAVLGGHPESAFLVGASAGGLALARLGVDPAGARRALAALGVGALLAAPSLAPFVEYLWHSGARVARATRPPAGEPDWIVLGLLVLGCGVVLRARDAFPAAERAKRVATSGLLALGCVALLVGAARDGLPETARLLLWPDAFGTATGYRGPSNLLEAGSAWVPVATLGLALAAFVGPTPARGLPQRGWFGALGAIALFVAVGLPGVTEAFKLLPGVGLMAPARLALVSSLALGLVAAEALERHCLAARAAGVLAVGALALVALRPDPLPQLDPALRTIERQEDALHFVRVPGERLRSGDTVEGWVVAELRFASMRLAATRVEADGTPRGDVVQYLPMEVASGPWRALPAAEAAAVPDGALHFRASALWPGYLAAGHWRLAVELIGADGAPFAERVASVSTVERVPAPRRATRWLLAAALAAAGLLPGHAAWLVVALAAAQSVHFLHDANPAVPRREVFPLTRTEELLARLLAGPERRRYLADPGVLPANTGMVRGLACLDGYDALDVASFDGYRSAALRPGVPPLVGWNARGVDLDAVAFRLFGVGALVGAAPLEHADWELVAAPAAGGAAERAACWIYRARAPLPRAFVVTAVAPREEVLADLDAFDPLRAAFLEDGASWTPRGALAERAEARVTFADNDTLEVEVALDGDGLLVLTEQHFPGWRAHVDGRPTPVLRVDSIFRGVPLERGARRVVFRYRPRSLTVGLLLALVGLAGLLAGARWPLRREPGSGA